MKTDFIVGDKLKCINADRFPSKEVAPPLKVGEIYELKEIITTVGHHDHLDVGLKSNYNYISCEKTGVQIPRGEFIHWCHPSRFEKI
jgi:hypothetical protein